MTRIVSTLAEISHQYDALFVDLWGCVHNGVSALPDAVAALQEYRKSGGKVILVTNSPRPRAGVIKQLDRFGVAEDCWDSISTSGDSARSAMYRGVVGEKIYFIGEHRDQDFFKPLDILENPVDIQQVPLEEAEGIVCAGPFDPMADLDVMRPQFLYAKQKGLKIGIFCALHTFGRRLTWHPHVHASVTLGGINTYGDWKALSYCHQKVEKRWRNQLCDFLLSQYDTIAMENSEQSCRDYDEFRRFINTQSLFPLFDTVR